MVEQGKRQLLSAWTKGELRTGGDEPSPNSGRSHGPEGKSAPCFVGEPGEGVGGGRMDRYERMMVPQLKKIRPFGKHLVWNCPR